MPDRLIGHRREIGDGAVVRQRRQVGKVIRTLFRMPPLRRGQLRNVRIEAESRQCLGTAILRKLSVRADAVDRRVETAAHGD